MAPGNIHFMRTTHLLCLVGLIAACSPEPERPPATPPVRTFLLNTEREARFRQFPGEVSASANGRLSFDVSGRLVRFPIYDGMIVEAGQIVGELDRADFQPAFDSAQARFNKAREDFERSRTLFERRVIARAEFDSARRTFEVAEAEFRTAEKALNDTRLIAPFKGRVAHRFVRNFQNVSAGELVILLQDVSTLEIDIQLPENMMSLGGRSMTAAEARELIEAKAEFAALPGEFFDLKLKSFATRANPTSRTFLVSFTCEPPEDRNLLPGMTSTVFVRLRGVTDNTDSQDPVFLVPVNAVAKVDGQSVVWRLDPKTMTVSRVAIDIIGPTGGSMEVTSKDLQPGDELVSSGVRFLAEGMTVRRFETVPR
jgi:RND family efflux transporter MFP subunit